MERDDRTACTYPSVDSGAGFSRGRRGNQHQGGHWSNTPNYPFMGEFQWIQGESTGDIYSNTSSGGDELQFNMSMNQMTAASSMYPQSAQGQRFAHDGRILINENNTGQHRYGFKCRLCKQLFFKHYREIAEHCQTLHKDHPFICEKCGRCYNTSTAYRCHLREHERRFQCTYCGRRFAKSTHCRVHMRIHTGEAPVECDLCGARFKASAGLWYHKKKKKCSKTEPGPVVTSVVSLNPESEAVVREVNSNLEHDIVVQAVIKQELD